MKRKLLFLIDEFFSPAGTERILSVVANGLVKQYDVAILTAWNGGRPDAFPLDERVRRFDLGMDAHGYALRILRKRDLRRRLFHFLSEHHFDVCVSLGGRNTSLLPQAGDGSQKVLWYHFCLNKELMQRQDPHASWASRWARLRTYHRKIRAAQQYKHLVVLTERDRQLWSAVHPHVHCIYNVVTVEPRPVQSYAVKRAVAVGRLTYQKGFDRLIRAWHLLQGVHPQWQLDIYGEGGLRSELQALIDRLDLTDKVHLRGNCADMPSAYAAHSLAVMSSHFEGLPLALLEAAACGLPLVAFDCECGPSEVIRHGENGFLVKSEGGEDALAHALAQLMESQPLRQRMGQAAPQSLQAFAPERVFQQWHTFLQRILAPEDEPPVADRENKHAND